MNQTHKKEIKRRRTFVISLIVVIVLVYAAIILGITQIINTGFGVKNGGVAESSHATALTSTQSETED